MENVTALMKIRLLKRYPPEPFTIKILKSEYRIFAVRGPRGVTKSPGARHREQSYDLAAEGTDNDAIYLERAISREKDPELRKALEDLDDFLFGY